MVKKEEINKEDPEEKLISDFFGEYENEEEIPENELFCLISAKWLQEWFEGVDIKISDRYIFAQTLPKKILTQIRMRKVVTSNPTKEKEPRPTTTKIKNVDNELFRYTSVPLSHYPDPKKLRKKAEKRRRSGKNARERERLRKLAEKRRYYREKMPRVYNDIEGEFYENAFVLLSDGKKSAELTFTTIKNGTAPREYAIVPVKAWEYFVRTYGIEGDNHPIKRAFNPTLNTVETYPMTMSFYDPTDDTNSKKVRLFASKTIKFGSLRSELSACYGNDERRDVRIWLGSNMYMCLDERYDKKDIESIVNINGAELVIELYNKANEVKEPLSIGKLCASIWYAIASIITAILCMIGLDIGDGDVKQQANIPEKLLREGVCGLKNLGNTCYMNSALQCLSNTPSLATYFMSDEYKEEINVDAVLGTKGQVTEAFGNLIRRMWDKTNRYCSPSSFRSTFAKYNRTFRGYNQQDAHEFLSALLDNLNEDLNHVKEKPYIEAVSSDGNGDESEIAKEAWENQLKREDSVIVRDFYGQMRSESSCDSCGRKSVTFSSFNSLSLPLPLPPPKNYLIKCTVVFAKEVIPVKYGIEVPEIPAPLVRDIRIKLEVLTGKRNMHLVLLSKYGSIVPDTRHVPKDAELTFYQVDENAKKKLPMLFIENVIEEDDDDDDEEEDEDGNDGDNEDGKMKEEESFIGTTTIGFPSLIQLDASTETNEDSDTNGNDGSVDANNNNNNNDDDDDDDSDDDEEEIGSVLSVSTLYELIWNKEKRKVPDYAESFNGKYPFVVYGLNKDKSIRKLEMDEEVDLEEFVHVPGGVSKFELHWEKELFENDDSDIHDMFKGVVKDESLKELEDKHTEKTEFTLDSCMKLFTSEEELESEERWNCGECKRDDPDVTSKKKVEIWKLPNKLIVHLNRFKMDGNREEKLTQPIQFEVDSWDLSQYVLDPEAKKEQQKYRLYALISHKGASSRYGHYVAYARNRVDGRWYNFDDESCSGVDVAKVKETEAYVLFYEKIEETEKKTTMTKKKEDKEKGSKTSKK